MSRTTVITRPTDHQSRLCALFSLDMDVEAERFMLINRNTGLMVRHQHNSPSGIVKIILPATMGVSPEFLVGILDDDLTYDCKFVDGQQLEIVDINTVDLSQ